MDGVTGGKSLPERLISEIVAKSDGVPLFVEEFTKSMLESGIVRETKDAFVFDGARQSIKVPASLHDSLMARLDRLHPYKEIAQTASCIGREFDRDLLARVCNAKESVLGDASRVSWTRDSFIVAAVRRNCTTPSSMPWCAMRPMRACCVRSERRSTDAWSTYSSKQQTLLRKSLLSMLLKHE